MDSLIVVTEYAYSTKNDEDIKHAIYIAERYLFQKRISFELYTKIVKGLRELRNE